MHYALKKKKNESDQYWYPILYWPTKTFELRMLKMYINDTYVECISRIEGHIQAHFQSPHCCYPNSA